MRRSFWETASPPNPGRSRPHWLPPMTRRRAACQERCEAMLLSSNCCSPSGFEGRSVRSHLVKSCGSIVVLVGPGAGLGAASSSPACAGGRRVPSEAAGPGPSPLSSSKFHSQSQPTMNLINIERDKLPQRLGGIRSFDRSRRAVTLPDKNHKIARFLYEDHNGDYLSKNLPPLPTDRSDIDVHGILQGYEVCV